MPERDNKEWQKSRRRLIRGLRKIIDECEQIGRDISYWNQHRTDAAPFDLGGELVAVAMAKECLARVIAGEELPDALWNRLVQQLEANANA